MGDWASDMVGLVLNKFCRAAKVCDESVDDRILCDDLAFHFEKHARKFPWHMVTPSFITALKSQKTWRRRSAIPKITCVLYRVQLYSTPFTTASTEKVGHDEIMPSTPTPKTIHLLYPAPPSHIFYPCASFFCHWLAGSSAAKSIALLKEWKILHMLTIIFLFFVVICTCSSMTAWRGSLRNRVVMPLF